MKKFFIFLFLLFIFSCQANQANTPLTEEVVSTNYQNMIKLIEYENNIEDQIVYIDGSVNSLYPITSVVLSCYTKSGKLLEKKEGTYNAENFTFTLNLKKGDYIISIEATDIYGNKYIHKNTTLSLK